MGQLLDTAVRLIPKPQDTDQIRYKDGDTSKIIEVVREADKIAANERLVKRFAPLLRGADDFKTCRNVWDFIRQQVPYVADEMGYERVRLPNKCLYDAKRYRNGGDCKTFTVLACDLLRENGIPSTIRFIAQGGAKAKHVYTVALINDREVPCDGVYHLFNLEPFRTLKWDFPATIGRGGEHEAVTGFRQTQFTTFF